MMNKLHVLILAGGRGTRLSSIVPDRPKPMADISGQPFLSYQFDYLISQGVTEVFISVGYLSQVIKDFYQDQYQSLKINYVQENTPLGTGGAIRYGVSQIKKSGNYLVLNGDTFFNLNLKSFEHFFEKTKADMVIGLAQVSNTQRYGRAVLDSQSSQILALGEKNSEGPGWINAGAYLFSERLLKIISQVPEGCFSWETEVLAKAPELKIQLFGFCSENSDFIDIGIPEDYARAQIVLPEWGVKS